MLICSIDEIAFEKPLWYFLEVETKATIQIHPISSNSAARSFSLSGHWQVSAGTSACVSSPYLCAGGSPHPQPPMPPMPAMPQLFQLTVLLLSSKAALAVAQLACWAFSQSSRSAGTLWGSCSMALTNRSCSSSLTLECAAAKGIQVFLSRSLNLYPVVVTKSWKLLKPLIGSSDKGKNLCNNKDDHTFKREGLV